SHQEPLIPAHRSKSINHHQILPPGHDPPPADTPTTQQAPRRGKGELITWIPRLEPSNAAVLPDVYQGCIGDPVSNSGQTLGIPLMCAVLSGRDAERDRGCTAVASRATRRPPWQLRAKRTIGSRKVHHEDLGMRNTARRLPHGGTCALSSGCVRLPLRWTVPGGRSIPAGS
ncbi:MAG: hypothetical protein QOE71_1429, partial [Pseudonocardiales bacterium]|nr:hypothetical protein [Pseudonocardiales bacterium]